MNLAEATKVCIRSTFVASFVVALTASAEPPTSEGAAQLTRPPAGMQSENGHDLAPPPFRSFVQEDVVNAIRLKLRAIQRCYEQELRGGTFRGLLRFRFTVEPSGRTSDVITVQDSLHNASVRGCVRDILGNLSFELAPSAPRTFTYPFVFQPRR
ncbi:MAG: AgmX/PglI C-terminal domain-containing protein [Myxococcota bacterium]